MSRKKLTEEQKKKKTGISIDIELLDILSKYLDENNIKKSIYIENLILEDLRKRNIHIEKKF